MKTVKNEELIAQMLQELDMSKEELAYFIESLNEVFIKQLIDKKEVIVEGLGEFRLVWSNHHKNQKLDDSSPHQYYKLKFEPEQPLKELINKDFSFLSIVDLSHENAINMPINILSKQAEDIKDILSEIQDSTNRIDTYNIDIEEEQENNKAKTVEESVAPIEYNIYMEKEDTTPEPTAKAEEQPKPFSPETETTQPKPTYEHSYNQADSQPTDSDDSRIVITPKRSRRWLWLTIGAVAMVAIAILLIKRQKDDIPDEIPIAAIDSTEHKDTVALADSIERVAVAEENDTLFFAQREYSDFIDTVRAEAGVTFVQLALEYYGDKRFWVYIYEANKDVIPKANHINIGTRIYIPRMEEKYLNKQDTFIINKVKKLGYYYAK